MNPESETGNTAEPGELMNFLRFNVISSDISTNVGLPATLHHFPHSVPERNVMTIPLNANANTTLLWEWEFAELGPSVNAAQGDSLSFSISFTLVDELYPEVTEEENEDPPLHYGIPPDYDPPDRTGKDKPVDDSEEEVAEPDDLFPGPDITPDEPDVIEPLPSVDVTEPGPDDSLPPVSQTDIGSSGLAIWIIAVGVFALVIVIITLALIKRRRRVHQNPL